MHFSSFREDVYYSRAHSYNGDGSHQGPDDEALDLSLKSSRRWSLNDQSAVGIVSYENIAKGLRRKTPGYEKSYSSTSVGNQFNICTTSTINQDQSSKYVDHEQNGERQVGHMQISSQTDQSYQQEALNITVVKGEHSQSLMLWMRKLFWPQIKTGGSSTPRQSSVCQNDVNIQYIAYHHMFLLFYFLYSFTHIYTLIL